MSEYTKAFIKISALMVLPIFFLIIGAVAAETDVYRICKAKGEYSSMFRPAMKCEVK